MDRQYFDAHCVDGVFRQPWHGPELPPPPRVNDLSAECHRNLKIMGVPSLYKPDGKSIERVQKAVDRAWYLFPAEITVANHPPIVGVYLFDADSCRGEWQKADGMASWFTLNGMDGYSVFGISKAAIAWNDDDYLQFLVLHELCHLLAVDGYTVHSILFHAKLDELLNYYNFVYGTALCNDYFDFNGECDFRRAP